MQKISICGILVWTKRFTEFYKSHGRLTENVPFTNRKKMFYSSNGIIHNDRCEQGQSVI